MRDLTLEIAVKEWFEANEEIRWSPHRTTSRALRANERMMQLAQQLIEKKELV